MYNYGRNTIINTIGHVYNHLIRKEDGEQVDDLVNVMYDGNISKALQDVIVLMYVHDFDRNSEYAGIILNGYEQLTENGYIEFE